MVDDKYYRNASNVNKSRPIFFYAGNEGDIYSFYNNSGFMTETLAEQYGALVVFGEHRYFGKSFPFPKDKAFKAPFNSYLTVENTLEDYNQLIKFVKQKWGAQDKAVIAFGGSYGGMLAAWMRMKYPQTIQGAIAASAPILYFEGSSSAKPGDFSDIVTNDFKRTYPDYRCSLGIKEAFTTLMSLKERSGDWADLGNIMKVCDPIKKAEDIQSLYYLIANGFTYMAMTDYPYASSFLQPMPGFPVNAACDAFKDIAP